MNYCNYYDILNNFINLNRKQWGDVMLGYLDEQSNDYKYEPYLAFYVKNWIMWQDLLKKYSHKQLSDYLIEVIRKELPQLNGIRLYIYNSDKLILELSKEESDKFLYII